MNRVLDTNIILYLLSGQLKEAPGEGTYYASVITRLELLSYPSLTPSEAETIQRLFQSVRVIPLDDEIESLAIGIRREYALKLPDAIVCATALALNAELLTNDAALQKVSRLHVRRLDLSKS